MDALFDLIKMYQLEILICIAFLGIISLIISIVNSIQIRNINRRYMNLTRGIEGENIEIILNSYMNNVEDALKDVKEVERNCKNLSSQLQYCIQKVGIVRYNAFDDVGSNQSYSIALLDKYNNGIVLTGLFGRDSSTTYAKPIKKGKSIHPLSDEENQVLLEAIE